MQPQDELKWNRGGWLGSQLGGSAWILVAGLLTLPKNLPVAMGVIALFGIANIVGWILWRRRETFSAYLGIQILLPVLGLCGLGAVFLLERSMIYGAIQHGGTVSASKTYLILILVVVLLMLVFYISFGRRHHID